MNELDKSPDHRVGLFTIAEPTFVRDAVWGNFLSGEKKQLVVMGIWALEFLELDSSGGGLKRVLYLPLTGKPMSVAKLRPRGSSKDYIICSLRRSQDSIEADVLRYDDLQAKFVTEKRVTETNRSFDPCTHTDNPAEISLKWVIAVSEDMQHCVCRTHCGYTTVVWFEYGHGKQSGTNLPRVRYTSICVSNSMARVTAISFYTNDKLLVETASGVSEHSLSIVPISNSTSRKTQELRFHVVLERIQPTDCRLIPFGQAKCIVLSRELHVVIDDCCKVSRSPDIFAGDCRLTGVCLLERPCVDDNSESDIAEVLLLSEDGELGILVIDYRSDSHPNFEYRVLATLESGQKICNMGPDKFFLYGGHRADCILELQRDMETGLHKSVTCQPASFQIGWPTGACAYVGDSGDASLVVAGGAKGHPTLVRYTREISTVKGPHLDILASGLHKIDDEHFAVSSMDTTHIFEVQSSAVYELPTYQFYALDAATLAISPSIQVTDKAVISSKGTVFVVGAEHCIIAAAAAGDEAALAISDNSCWVVNATGQKKQIKSLPGISFMGYAGGELLIANSSVLAFKGEQHALASGPVESIVDCKTAIVVNFLSGSVSLIKDQSMCSLPEEGDLVNVCSTTCAYSNNAIVLSKKGHKGKYISFDKECFVTTPLNVKAKANFALCCGRNLILANDFGLEVFQLATIDTADVAALRTSELVMTIMTDSYPQMIVNLATIDQIAVLGRPSDPNMDEFWLDFRDARTMQLLRRYPVDTESRIMKLKAPRSETGTYSDAILVTRPVHQGYMMMFFYSGTPYDSKPEEKFVEIEGQLLPPHEGQSTLVFMGNEFRYTMNIMHAHEEWHYTIAAQPLDGDCDLYNTVHSGTCSLHVGKPFVWEIDFFDTIKAWRIEDSRIKKFQCTNHLVSWPFTSTLDHLPGKLLSVELSALQLPSEMPPINLWSCNDENEEVEKIAMMSPPDYIRCGNQISRPLKYMKLNFKQVGEVVAKIKFEHVLSSVGGGHYGVFVVENWNELTALISVVEKLYDHEHSLGILLSPRPKLPFLDWAKIHFIITYCKEDMQKILSEDDLKVLALFDQALHCAFW